MSARMTRSPQRMTHAPDRQPAVTAEQIDAILPQTQCRQCGFDGCRPYAEAMAEGKADVNRCPPGGEEGIRQLAALTGKVFKLFEADAPQPKPRARAVIDENNCIGCTLCIQACPVDAILGAGKLMHTVIREACTGCELCIAPCPVDAISMIPLDPPAGRPSPAEADRARIRHQSRLARLARDREEKVARQAKPVLTAQAKPASEASAEANTLDEQKKAVIAAAMRRAAERQARRKTGDDNT